MPGRRAPIIGQLAHPRGALAPATGFMLNIVNRPINRWAVTSLKLAGSEQVLDVGFGGGIGLEMVGARLRDGRVTGIDISQEMARAATGRFPVVRADVAAIPFADGSFDLVYSVNTIFFWPDVRSGLSEIRRVLRQGGRAVIAAPNAAFWLARWARLWPPTGVMGLRDARKIARDVGFAEVSVRDRGAASLLVAGR